MIYIHINLFIPVELDESVVFGGMVFYTWIHHILDNFITDILAPITNEHLGVDLFHEANLEVSPSGYLSVFLTENIVQLNKHAGG